MVRLGFLNNQNAPTPEAAQCLPSTSACDSQAIQSERKIFIFHDESIFNAYDDQKVQWGRSDMQTIRPKGKGSGIMVSDFVEENMGFLNFLDDSGKKNIARVLLEYGQNREGYWTSEKFLQQMDHAVTIAKSKYPGAQIIWIFDNSSCHNAYADNALIAAHMNANPGGKQHCLRDTVWQGRVQKMNTQDEIPKGLIQVLKERGRYGQKMKLEEI